MTATLHIICIFKEKCDWTLLYFIGPYIDKNTFLKWVGPTECENNNRIDKCQTNQVFLAAVMIIYFTMKVMYPADTKHLHLYNICTTTAKCLRRWFDDVQMLHKCFVFTV